MLSGSEGIEKTVASGNIKCYVAIEPESQLATSQF